RSERHTKNRLKSHITKTVHTANSRLALIGLFSWPAQWAFSVGLLSRPAQWACSVALLIIYFRLKNKARIAGWFGPNFERAQFQFAFCCFFFVFCLYPFDVIAIIMFSW